MIFEDLYNLGRISLAYIAEKSTSVIQFFSRSIADILIENLEAFTGGLLEDFVIWLTETLLKNFPILSEVSLFTFMLGGAIAFYTVFNIIRLLKDLAF